MRMQTGRRHVRPPSLSVGKKQTGNVKHVYVQAHVHVQVHVHIHAHVHAQANNR